MSTYYTFICTECKMSGGFYSRQAWGWGNANIIETFKFLMKHSCCVDPTDADHIKKAIRMLRGVIKIDPIVDDSNAWCIRRQVTQELYQKIWEVLK